MLLLRPHRYESNRPANSGKTCKIFPRLRNPSPMIIAAKLYFCVRLGEIIKTFLRSKKKDGEPAVRRPKFADHDRSRFTSLTRFQTSATMPDHVFEVALKLPNVSLGCAKSSKLRNRIGTRLFYINQEVSFGMRMLSRISQKWTYVAFSSLRMSLKSR